MHAPPYRATLAVPALTVGGALVKGHAGQLGPSVASQVGDSLVDTVAADVDPAAGDRDRAAEQ